MSDNKKQIPVIKIETPINFDMLSLAVGMTVEEIKNYTMTDKEVSAKFDRKKKDRRKAK